MFKIIILSIALFPSVLCGLCRDCDFPYQHYLNTYQPNYENMAMLYGGEVIKDSDLNSDRERAIFYSGCAFSLEQMIHMEYDPY